MTQHFADGLTTLEYHVLLALASGPLHGYAIRAAVERESERTLKPLPGTLYRVIARLMDAGFACDSDGPGNEPPHPGRERRYYELTGEGRAALAAEARRLREAAALAQRRLGVNP
jgi:DNA-binding PadR family transcriptional regulator